MVRSCLIFMLLLVLKALSRIFYRFDVQWIDPGAGDPWSNHRLVAFLNHTSLFEPIFLGGVPARFAWRIAAHGVVPAAEKTTGRPLVGLIFKFIAHHVVPISRERDHTWFAVLDKIDPQAMMIIAPEGRMKRASGFDLQGNPMTVRGGIADILQAIGNGKMLIAYSGGLHHVQIPDHVPNVFRTVRLRLENVEIESYVAAMMADGGEESFKRNVREDLDRRRDMHAPEDHKFTDSGIPARQK